MTTKHTPTPYIAGQNWHPMSENFMNPIIAPPNGEQAVAVFPGENAEADCEFVLQACNLHDELLAACKAVLDYGLGNEDWGDAESCKIERQLEQAIAKASPPDTEYAPWRSRAPPAPYLTRRARSASPLQARAATAAVG